MSHSEESKNDDGAANAIAATAIIGIVVAVVVYWLSGLPS